jgi:hypothetical protein
MREKIIVGLIFAAGFVISLIVMWVVFPDLSESAHFAGISGALGGMIGAILGATYLVRIRDERFVEIENRSAKNAYMFLLIVLPLGAGFIGTMPSIQMAVGIVVGIWGIALAIFYLSLLYYYKR